MLLLLLLAEKLCSRCVGDEVFIVGTDVSLGISKKNRGSHTHVKSDKSIIKGGGANGGSLWPKT